VATLSDTDIQARIDSAVAKALGDVEARHAQQTKQLVADVEQARQRLQLAAPELDQAERRNGSRVLSAGLYNPPPAERGDLK
jgi:hypothetical protein